MRQLFLTCLVLSLVFGSVARVDAENADMTVRTADDILIEQTQMTGKRIPESLLAEAQGVAIIPDVIKIGFVAAVRRGHGVVLVRDANGAWTLPQFITITGGSVGWQAGIQGTDVVLVFMTKKSVQGLLKGKFTIGADASAAAGPVGRNAAAATDARLQAEILSYSRSRGLFAGVSLDGSVIEMNPATQSVYYDAPVGQPPVRVPESALKLVQDLTQLSSATRVAPPTVAQPAVAPSPDTSLQPVPQPAPVASVARSTGRGRDQAQRPGRPAVACLPGAAQRGVRRHQPATAGFVAKHAGEVRPRRAIAELRRPHLAAGIPIGVRPAAEVRDRAIGSRQSHAGAAPAAGESVRGLLPELASALSARCSVCLDKGLAPRGSLAWNWNA